MENTTVANLQWETLLLPIYNEKTQLFPLKNVAN